MAFLAVAVLGGKGPAAESALPEHMYVVAPLDRIRASSCRTGEIVDVIREATADKLLR